MIPFVAAVTRALPRGVLQGYRSEEDALPTVRGRIRFDEQIKRRYGRFPPSSSSSTSSPKTSRQTS